MPSIYLSIYMYLARNVLSKLFLRHIFLIVEKLFLTDPKLAKDCFFGPCSPYQYRLMGPGAWSGARQAILTQWKRIYQPFQTRPCDSQDDSSFRKLYIIIVLVLAVLLYFAL